MQYTDWVKSMVQAALAEDVGSGDITAALINSDKEVFARVITRENGVLCGVEFVREVYRQLDPSVQIEFDAVDGDRIERDKVLFRLKGCARSILTGERTALNFLQTLSGTATATAAYVDAITGTQAQLLDTRKTIPLFRYAQKYAVRCGGGKNHRMGLFDAFLIKENHITAKGSITAAIQEAQKLAPGKTIEVEVERLDQLEEAIRAGADIVMLDNFTLSQVRAAVIQTGGRVKLEVSGNITLETIREIAKTGVDYISCGSITKHVKALDLSMRIVR